MIEIVQSGSRAEKTDRASDASLHALRLSQYIQGG
jgi:hypothetical protein